MTITYESKKGKIYCLQYRTNADGKKIFFLTRDPKKGEAADAIPATG